MKFKVWDSKKKKFDNDKDFCITPSGFLLVPDESYKYVVDERFTPVLHTGQSDKNNVELFYEDIVKDLSGGLLIMKWDKGVSMMYLKVIYNSVRVDFLKSYVLEKVGSTFENPELLT